MIEQMGNLLSEQSNTETERGKNYSNTHNAATKMSMENGIREGK
jgi:hypothetical protein